MPFKLTTPIEWSELIRSIVQSIYEDQGAVTVIIIVQSLLTLVLFGGLALGTWSLLTRKQKEVDRMAKEKAKLESELLKQRLSTQTPKVETAR